MRNLLLTLVYYLVVTPISLLRRLASDPLHRTPPLSHDSYLINCKPTQRNDSTT